MSMFVGRQTSDMDPPDAGNGSDFDFDEMPEEGLVGGGAPHPDDIDAVNDETFGGEVSGMPDDLEKFAMQTASLRLDDVNAPDPLSLPMPAFSMFGEDLRPKDSQFDSNKGLKNIWEFNPATDKTYDLWGSIFDSPAVDSAPSTSNAPSFANIARGMSPGPIGSKPTARQQQNGSCQNVPPIGTPLNNGKPSGISPAKSHAESPLPSFPAGTGVLSLADLEKRMINEASMINRGAPPPGLSTSQYPPRPSFPPELAQKMFAAQSGMNRPPPHIPNAYAHAPPGRPWLPGFPMMPPPGMRVPPPRYPAFGVPPGPHMQKLPHPVHHDNHRNYKSFNNSQSFDQMSVASDHSRGPHRHKKPGMPSGRTISDFAFDPYAGFMSCKEREWLIKIQLLQCNGSGNPEEDDFYYHHWKLKNGITTNEVQKKLDGNYYSFDADKDRSHAYVPPNFEGTLGRPTHVTASVPRQIIDIHQGQQQ